MVSWCCVVVLPSSIYRLLSGGWLVAGGSRWWWCLPSRSECGEQTEDNRNKSKGREGDERQAW